MIASPATLQHRVVPSSVNLTDDILARTFRHPPVTVFSYRNREHFVLRGRLCNNYGGGRVCPPQSIHGHVVMVDPGRCATLYHVSSGDVITTIEGERSVQAVVPWGPRRWLVHTRTPRDRNTITILRVDGASSVNLHQGERIQLPIMDVTDTTTESATIAMNVRVAAGVWAGELYDPTTGVCRFMMPSPMIAHRVNFSLVVDAGVMSIWDVRVGKSVVNVPRIQTEDDGDQWEFITWETNLLMFATRRRLACLPVNVGHWCVVPFESTTPVKYTTFDTTVRKVIVTV